jgi:micrococcal nuclease
MNAPRIVMRWLLLFVVMSAATAHAAEYTGSVNKVVDGDTFWLCDDSGCYKFRVCGINTPGRDEPGYAESKAALAVVVKGKPVRCVLVGGGTPCDGKSKPVSSDRFSLNASPRRAI